MAGIQSLMQGQQGPMPGQAPQAPIPGMMPKPSAATPASVVAQLNAQLSSNPEQRLNQLLQMYAQKPTLALLSQVSEATNAVELEKKKQQQDYMAAFAQQGPQTVADLVKQRAQQAAQQPVMAASGGIMQGYSGGGAVAFQYGGNPEIEQILQKSPMARTPEENAKLEAAGVQLTQRAIPRDSWINSLDRKLKGIFGSTVSPSYSSGIDEIVAAERGRKPTAMTSQQMEAAMKTPSAAPARSAAPNAGLADLVKKPSTAAPAAPPTPQDTPLKIEIDKLRKQEEDLAKQTGEISPELAQARKEQLAARAAGLEARGGIERRLTEDVAERKAELDRRRGLAGLQNTPLLMALAAGAKGKTVGDVMSGALGAGREEVVRQETRMKELEDQLRASRLGVDQATIAKMDYDSATNDLKVAQLTGDRDKITAAKTKLLEAQRHLLDVQQREAASQLQSATTIKAAQIGAAAKESASDLAERRYNLQQLQRDPEYIAAVNKIKELSKAAGLSNSPTVQTAFKAAQQEALAVAKRYGVAPQDIGAAGAGAAGGREINFADIGKK